MGRVSTHSVNQYFVLVTIINIVRCPTVVVCQMLWPELLQKLTTLTNVRISRHPFLRRVTVFLSVCTIYFLNIKGYGKLFNRQPWFHLFSMHDTPGWCVCVRVRTVKMAKQFFYLLYVFVCVMINNWNKEIQTFFYFKNIVILKPKCFDFHFAEFAGIWICTGSSQTSKNFLAMFAILECIKNSNRK